MGVVSRTDPPLTHRTAAEPIEPGVVDLPFPDGRENWRFYETFHELPPTADQEPGTYVVVDAINFSTTVAWMFDRGVSTVVPLVDRASAERFGDENPGALVGGDYAFESGDDSLVRNSPTDCAERGIDWADRVVGLNSINGANAVRAVRDDAAVVVASPVNARAVADWLDTRGEGIHFVAAGTRGSHAVEDTFGVYRVVHHLLNEDSPAADAMHLRLLDHLYANASHLEGPPDLHPDQHVVRAFDSLSAVPVREAGEGAFRVV
jgi:phosphosulfolactate phosphohydrolase-like enzyme